MTELNRAFKGIWIPKEIWLNKDLTVMEKLFLVEIDSLDNDKGCYASNKYFAEFFGISKGRCSQIINSLNEKQLISIEYFYEGKEVKKRTIKVVNKLNRVVNKLNDPIKNIKQGYLENAKESNTSFNNTSNSNTRESGSQRDKDLEYLVQRYQDIGYGSISPSAYMTFEKLLDKGFTAEAIERAYQIASDVNRKHQAYINGILRKWEEAGIKTVEQIEEQEIKFREKAEVKKKVYDPLAKWRDEDEEVEYIENENDPLAKWR